MKKFQIFLLFSLFIFKQQPESYAIISNDIYFSVKLQDTTRYQVYEIDSINNYYLIYAKKNDMNYKMVSKKYNDSNCTSLMVGNYYNFKLHSVFSSNGEPLFLKGMAHLYAWKPDENTVITLEGDGAFRNLFFIENLKGLCYDGYDR